MVNFQSLIIKAQDGDEEAICDLLHLYTPLIEKNSYLWGKKDEDLHGELILAFLKCIRNFKIDIGDAVKPQGLWAGERDQ